MKSITINNGVGNIVSVSNELQTGVSSYLSRDVGVSVTAYVENPTDFINGMYLIGKLATENAEIARITGVTLPTNSVPGTVTFSSVITNRHTRGDLIQYIAYDQIELWSCATETGTYALVSGTNPLTVQVSSKDTIFVDQAGTPTTFYKVRYKNSISGLYSDYSVPFSASTVTQGTAGEIINQAKSSIGAQEDHLLTPEFMIKALNDARDIVHRNYGYGKAKDYLHKFEHPIKMLAGTNYVPLPTDIDFMSTNRSLFRARFATSLTPNGYPLSYIDKSDWNMSSYGLVSNTTLSSAILGATTLVLNNSGDFPDTGTITIQAEDYNGTVITTSYTANNRVTNTLTLSSGLSRAVSANMQVTTNTSVAYPTQYTVYDGKIVFSKCLPQIFNGRNLVVDYYRKQTPITQMSDTLPEPYYSIYEHYLRFAIKKRRDDSLGEDDADYKMFKTSIDNIFGNDYIGQTIRIR